MAAGNNTGGEEWAITDALPADALANLARIVLAEETLDSVHSKVGRAIPEHRGDD